MTKKVPEDDPTRVLDGWVPGAGKAPLTDPTRVLDGWTAKAGREAPARDATLPLIETWQPSGAAALPDPEVSRLPENLNLRVPTKYSKWDTRDVTDVDAVWKQADFVAAAAQEPARSDDWQPGAIAGLRKAPVPRLLNAWKPGAWIGAVKPVFGSVAQVVSTRHGPVVDTFEPHVLLALWPPQSMHAPFLGRWPLRLLLSAVQPEDAGAELLRHMPADAELWLSEHDIDWALAGEAVLLHEPGLRDFQLKELRAFVDAERQATWDQVNKAYKLPGTGQPIERI